MVLRDDISRRSLLFYARYYNAACVGVRRAVDYPRIPRIHYYDISSVSEARKNGCPPEFVRVSGSCYFFSTTPETWHDAHFECRDRNANLAVVQKKWQDKNLRFYLNHSRPERVDRWIGGIFNWKAMIWVWGPTGKPLRYKGFPKKHDPADNQWKCIAMDRYLKYRYISH
ncbi:UNVERIFIED_CONTAM: hypothetical protein PYX00_007338 [Menopon gallinae]|uniref:C-type lectin domain-containing protein n=1 Tax=Menopon gallinae TaxID=328185 RepID=A0AAW2HJ03_9NEOP